MHVTCTLGLGASQRCWRYVSFGLISPNQDTYALISVRHKRKSNCTYCISLDATAHGASVGGLQKLARQHLGQTDTGNIFWASVAKEILLPMC